MGASDEPHDRERDAAAEPAAEYKPAVNDYALGLIARLQRDQRDQDALQLLCAHYESHGDYPSLANLLEGWARTLRDDRRASAAYVSAGDAVLKAKLDKNRARRLFEAAIDRYPESDDALDRLETLLRDLSDDTGHERVLTHMARALKQRNADPTLRAAAHYRLGQHYELRLMLPGKAISEYRTAVDLDPQLVPAITSARRIYEGAQKYQAAADMYELEIATVREPQARHELLLALAAHQRDFLEDLDAAVRAVRRALKTLPDQLATMELLADLLAERASHYEEGAPTLSGQQHAGHYEDGTPDAEAEKAEARAEADRYRAGEIYYQLARLTPRGEAAGRLETCLALCPTHARAQRMLDELMGYRSEGDPTLPGSLEAPLAAERTQAQIDDATTGRFSVAAEDDVTQPRATSPVRALDSVTDWIDEDDLELVDENIGTDSMVPVTEPPPPMSTTRAVRSPAHAAPPLDAARAPRPSPPSVISNRPAPRRVKAVAPRGDSEAQSRTTTAPPPPPASTRAVARPRTSAPPPARITAPPPPSANTRPRTTAPPPPLTDRPSDRPLPPPPAQPDLAGDTGQHTPAPA